MLSDIQEVAAMVLKDKEAFYGRLSRRMEKQYLADTDSLKKEYESLAGRNQEIDDTFISLYADKAKRILTEKRFLKLTDAMEKEQESNQNCMQEIAALISEEEHSEGDVQMFMGEIKRYAAITEHDETVLNRLINHILIGEPKKVGGVKTQEVRIVYNLLENCKKLETMSVTIQQMWFLLTLGFQALKYQGKQPFFHVRGVVIFASFL